MIKQYRVVSNNLLCEIENRPFSLDVKYLNKEQLTIFNNFQSLCNRVVESITGEQLDIVASHLLIDGGVKSDRIAFQLANYDLKSTPYKDVKNLELEDIQIINSFKSLFNESLYVQNYNIESDKIQSNTGDIINVSSIDLLVAVDVIMEGTELIQMSINLCNPFMPSEFLLIKGEQKQMYKFHEQNETISNAFKSYIEKVNKIAPNFIPNYYAEIR